MDIFLEKTDDETQLKAITSKYTGKEFLIVKKGDTFYIHETKEDISLEEIDKRLKKLEEKFI